MVGSGKKRQRGSRIRVAGWLVCRPVLMAQMGKNSPVSVHFWGVPESLTRGKPGKKESPRLASQNRRMFPAMRTILQSSCERVQLTLTVVLLVACAANVALVCAWL